jgi:hypothetical protein
VTYRAAPGCPGEERFWGEVAARTDRVRRADGAEPARSFSVVVDAGPSGSRGALESTDVHGVTTRRDVTGDDCPEVVSALALIAALTVDSQARTDATVPPASSAEAPASVPFAAATAARPPSPPPPPSTLEVPLWWDQMRKEPAPHENPPFNFRWSIGAQGQALGGLTPKWAFGVGAFVALSDDSANTFAPSFRLTPWFATTHAIFEGELGADITWYVARLEACPVAPKVSPALRFEACLGMDGGVMYTTGVGVDHPDSQTNPWFAPLLAGRLLWSISESIRVEAGLGATVPLRRYPFVFTPAGGAGPQTFHDLAPVGALLTLGVAYVFP